LALVFSLTPLRQQIVIATHHHVAESGLHVIICLSESEGRQSANWSIYPKILFGLVLSV